VHSQVVHLRNWIGLSSALLELKFFFEECQKVFIDLLLVCGAHAMRGAFVALRVAFLTILEESIAESAMGTI